MRSRTAEIGERYGLVLLLAVVIVFFSVSSKTPQFATAANIKNVLGNESILGIVAIATVLPLVAGQFDLSVGPNAGLCAMVTAGLMSKSGLPVGLAVLIGLCLGAFIGVINGALVSKVGINSIITTLGSASVIGGLIQWYSQGVSIVTGISTKLTNLGTGDWLGIPRPSYFLLVTAIVVWYVLEHTPVGRYLHGVGTNERAARLVGLRIERLVFSSFVFAGLLAGVAGVLLVAYQGGANPQIGSDFTLPALAAVFLGATAIRPGTYNVVGTIVAVFFLAITVNGLTLWGTEAWVSDVFNGVALIIAVGIAVQSGRRRKSRLDPTETDSSTPDTPEQTAVAA